MSRFATPRTSVVPIVAAIIAMSCAPAPRAAPAPGAVAAAAPAARGIPDRLSDGDFWKLVTDISEPGGYFQITDNYTSNEMEVGAVSTLLRETGVAGGVYVGVGPEQNFSYIAAIRPRMAFIIDIRRQAVMQHLMYKAMFELAADRADFLSMLFSKPRPGGLDTATSIQRMWDAYWNVPSDSVLGRRGWERVSERLVKTHGFTFTPDESAQLRAVYDAFYSYGPMIATRGVQTGRGGASGSGFADLTGYSMDHNGQAQSFLTSEANYRYVKSLHERNLIVPVSGDFGGPKALRGIGAYVRGIGGTVSAYYVSNVEQYLFQDGKNGAFYANVATLPVGDSSVFIRPYALRRGGGGAAAALCPIGSFLKAVEGGRVFRNADALLCVR